MSRAAPVLAGADRGYRVAYHRDEVNHCPGCGRTHWYVGRVSAECGFCATALPFATAEAALSAGFTANVLPHPRKAR